VQGGLLQPTDCKQTPLSTGQTACNVGLVPWQTRAVTRCGFCRSRWKIAQ